ncbi:MAG TPA: cysteine desulfurase family protein [Ignavibacteria bacterium]|nr:cysteine desulfurase family protein [Ignavibacteria bacterium]
MEFTYLDNASTTAIDPEVLDAMMPYLKENFGNASSIHSFGKSAKVLLEDARDTVANYIGASSKEIFFTNSGTESNNFAIKGLAFNFLNSGKNHIVSASIEHSAVIDTLNFLENKFRFEVTFIKPTPEGIILPEKIRSAIKENTFLVSVMHSNNETGLINDVKGISDLILDKDIFLHTDSVQSIGKTDFNVNGLNIDSATISAHKIYGPKGIAALYVKDKTPVEKFMHGGMQERNMRGGTENIASVAGFKKAIELLVDNFRKDTAHYNALKNYLTGKLKSIYGESIIFNSGGSDSLPNIVNISFDKNKLEYDEEMILIMLDLKGIAVSGGSACTAGTHKPSHVLTEIGLDKKTALGSVRISFGRYNTEGDIDKFVNALGEIVHPEL